MQSLMKKFFQALAALGFLAAALPVQAQDAFLGEVRMFAGTFAPRGWAFAHGQLLSISQNTALFSLLGTTYGGNGQTTFALPDLRGRAPIGWGQAPGLTPRNLGEVGGSENRTLTTQQMPFHNHALVASNAPATSSKPSAGQALAAIQGAGAYAAVAPNTMLSPQSVGLAGGSQPFDNMPPYLGVNYIIALEGIFPSQQ
jgi:microcystin-dependent protein